MSLQPVRGNPLRDASNRENQKPRQNLKGGANTRRNALGNVTNQVRKQPERAAKDKHSLVPGSRVCRGQENDVPIEGKKASFAVFEDSGQSISKLPVPHPEVVHMETEDKENSVQHQPVLHDAVIGLNPIHLAPPRHHMVLQPINDVDIASPMIVDPICEEQPETQDSRDEFGLDIYIPDIYNYMRSKEGPSRPNPDYMNRQVDVSKSMRNILVDWLVEVGEEYKLHRETLFLAINYIDRFLSLVGVQRPKLQLVGAACMYIAAKYEEIYPPEVGEFVYITDDTYTKSQVLKMESVILKLLDFKVAVPTVNWFCEHYLENAKDMNDTAKHLSFYLAELSLIELEDFLYYKSSVVAACCILLARSSLGFQCAWSPALERTSGYSIPDLLGCVKVLFDLYTRSKTMPQQAVVEKYKQEKLGRVALLPPPDVLAIH